MIGIKMNLIFWSLLDIGTISFSHRWLPPLTLPTRLLFYLIKITFLNTSFTTPVPRPAFCMPSDIAQALQTKSCSTYCCRCSQKRLPEQSGNLCWHEPHHFLTLMPWTFLTLVIVAITCIPLKFYNFGYYNVLIVGTIRLVCCEAQACHNHLADLTLFQSHITQ